jgi:hypothetical protein
MTKPNKLKKRREEPKPAEREEPRPDGEPDVTDPRAKSSAHKKVTADKWNQ